MALWLASQGPGSTRCVRKAAIIGVEDMALLESSSVLWPLTLKGPSWLVLFYSSVQQALKGEPWLESFSIVWCIRGSKCHLHWVFSLLVSYWCQHVESERLQ